MAVAAHASEGSAYDGLDALHTAQLRRRMCGAERVESKMRLRRVELQAFRQHGWRLALVENGQGRPVKRMAAAAFLIGIGAVIVTPANHRIAPTELLDETCALGAAFARTLQVLAIRLALLHVQQQLCESIRSNGFGAAHHGAVHATSAALAAAATLDGHRTGGRTKEGYPRFHKGRSDRAASSRVGRGHALGAVRLPTIGALARNGRAVEFGCSGQRDAAAAVGCTARLEQRMLILYVASAQVVPIQQL